MGMSEVNLESCLGVPDQHSSFGDTDNTQTYHATSTSNDSYSLPIIGGMSFGNGGYCHSTFQLKDQHVTQMADAKALLAAIQRHLVEAEVADYCRERRCCPLCKKQRPLKDVRTRRLNSLFGTVEVRAPRFKPCRCSVTSCASPARHSNTSASARCVIEWLCNSAAGHQITLDAEVSSNIWNRYRRPYARLLVRRAGVQSNTCRKRSSVAHRRLRDRFLDACLENTGRGAGPITYIGHVRRHPELNPCCLRTRSYRGFGRRLSGPKTQDCHSLVRSKGPFLGADLPPAERRAQVLSRMPLAAPARSAGSSWTRPSTALSLRS